MVGTMAQPLPVRKQAVDLAGGPRKVGSRIRRAPPPKPEKQLSAAEVREREAWVVGVGILAVAMALMIVVLAAARWAGWSPADYEITVAL
jgi:hypothetical protein